MSDILKSFLQNERGLKKYLSRFFSSPEDIDDVLQDVFLRAFVTEIRTGVRAPKLLLFRAAKHVALNKLARKSLSTTDYIEDMGGSSVFLDKRQSALDDQIDSKRKLLIFSQAVASLPPNCRKVFILRKFEGLPNKEIAKRMKISISGVEKHIAVGLAKCSQYLRHHGYSPSEFGRSVTAAEQTRADVSLHPLASRADDE